MSSGHYKSMQYEYVNNNGQASSSWSSSLGRYHGNKEQRVTIAKLPDGQYLLKTKENGHIDRKIISADKAMRLLDNKHEARLTGGGISKKDKVVLYTLSWCGWCHKAKELLDARGIKYTDHDIEAENIDIEAKFGRSGVPIIVINGKMIGGYTELESYLN